MIGGNLSIPKNPGMGVGQTKISCVMLKPVSQ